MDFHDVTKDIQLSSVAQIFLSIFLAKSCTPRESREGGEDAKWVRVQMHKTY